MKNIIKYLLAICLALSSPMLLAEAKIVFTQDAFEAPAGTSPSEYQYEYNCTIGGEDIRLTVPATKASFTALVVSGHIGGTAACTARVLHTLTGVLGPVTDTVTKIVLQGPPAVSSFDFIAMDCPSEQPPTEAAP